MIHLNHAGTSWPKAPGVAAAVQETLEAAPAQADDLLDDVRRRAADFLGLQDAGRLLFPGSCTAALALLLGDLPWRDGEVVVTSSLEHHALLRPIDALVRHRGVRHVAVPRAPGVPLDLDALRAVLRRERVRLVACTMASNVTGEILPVHEIAAHAHAHGASLLLDAAQTAGRMHLDATALGADLLVAAPHKGLLASTGVGVLHAAPHVLLESAPATCGDGEAAGACVPYPGWCDVGSVNLAAVAGLGVSLLHLQERTPEALLEEPRALAAEFRAWLRRRRGYRLLGDAADASRLPVAAFTVTGSTPAAVERHLAAAGLTVRAGMHCAPQAHRTLGTLETGAVRVSFGPGNSGAHLSTLCDALGRLG